MVPALRGPVPGAPGPGNDAAAGGIQGAGPGPDASNGGRCSRQVALQHVVPLSRDRLPDHRVSRKGRPGSKGEHYGGCRKIRRQPGSTSASCLSPLRRHQRFWRGFAVAPALATERYGRICRRGIRRPYHGNVRQLPQRTPAFRGERFAGGQAGAIH